MEWTPLITILTSLEEKKKKTNKYVHIKFSLDKSFSRKKNKHVLTLGRSIYFINKNVHINHMNLCSQLSSPHVGFLYIQISILHLHSFIWLERGECYPPHLFSNISSPLTFKNIYCLCTINNFPSPSSNQCHPFLIL